jgi:signal transduction histidine kinase
MDYHIRKKEFDKLSKPANDVKNHSQQLTLMLDNLLNWSFQQIKLKQVKPEITNVHALAKAEVELYKTMAKAKKTKIKIDIPKGTIANCEPQFFSIAVRNLIANAVKFTENGTIVLSAKNIDKQLVLSVSDTGIGIDKKYISGICEISEEKIKQGTRKEKGTGLGLNLVKEFVELNQGKIEFESEVNVGTKITLYLPLN